MAKGIYLGVGNVARKVKKAYIGIGGVARKIKKMYIGIGNVARLFFSGGELEYVGTITALSAARDSLRATTVGSYALFGGGYTSNFSNVVDAYNTSLTRSTPTALSTARSNLAATTVGSYALFGGGYVSTSISDVTRSNVVDAYTAD